MKFFIFLFICNLVNIANAQVDEENDVNEIISEIMVVSKVAGACGIFTLQLQFQDNTDLENGSQFIERFWTTEAMRLGNSLQEYALGCSKANEAYSAYWKMASE